MTKIKRLTPNIDKEIEEAFPCELGKNHCVTGTGDCENQSVIDGYCKYFNRKKFISRSQKEVLERIEKELNSFESTSIKKDGMYIGHTIEDGAKLDGKLELRENILSLITKIKKEI